MKHLKATMAALAARKPHPAHTEFTFTYDKPKPGSDHTFKRISPPETHIYYIYIQTVHTLNAPEMQSYALKSRPGRSAVSLMSSSTGARQGPEMADYLQGTRQKSGGCGVPPYSF